MPAGLMPLCPTCFDRAPAWTASRCPSCAKESAVAECDACQKSRAGSFVPDEAGGGEGGAQRFVCVDCMETMLEGAESDAMWNAVFAVILTFLAAVRFYDRFTWVPPLAAVLFAVSLVALAAWMRAALRRRRPARLRVAAWKLFAKRVDKALSKRPGGRVS